MSGCHCRWARRVFASLGATSVPLGGQRASEAGKRAEGPKEGNDGGHHKAENGSGAFECGHTLALLSMWLPPGRTHCCIHLEDEETGECLTECICGGCVEAGPEGAALTRDYAERLRERVAFPEHSAVLVDAVPSDAWVVHRRGRLEPR